LYTTGQSVNGGGVEVVKVNIQSGRSRKQGTRIGGGGKRRPDQRNCHIERNGGVKRKVSYKESGHADTAEKLLGGGKRGKGTGLEQTKVASPGKTIKG